MSENILKWFLYGLVRLLLCTYRYRYFGVEHYHRALQANASGVFCLGLFHCNALAGLLGHRGLRFSPLISQSRDGELIAFLSARLGLEPVRGSSSKGAVAAQRQLTRLLESGRCPAYTVDGPRGPRFRVKGGIIGLSATEGIPALPMAAIADRHWEFSSWDRFRLPKPFSRIAVIYGPALTVDSAAGRPAHPTPGDAPAAVPSGEPSSQSLRDLAHYRQAFQEALLALESSAVSMFSQWDAGRRQSALEGNAARRQVAGPA